MDPQQVMKSEQALTFVAESLPAHWRRVYENLLGQGFSEDHALQILKTYVHAQAGGRLAT